MKTNLFEKIPAQVPNEIFEVLLQRPSLKIERIISKGHASPEGYWYDQEENEWVMVLKGKAGLRLDDELGAIVILGPGDCINIPAHKKHRVDWTSQTEETIWLALFYT